MEINGDWSDILMPVQLSERFPDSRLFQLPSGALGGGTLPSTGFSTGAAETLIVIAAMARKAEKIGEDFIENRQDGT